MASIDRDNLDEFLSAYLDDELDEPDRATLQRLIAQDSYARSRLEQLRLTVELVRTLPRRGAPPEMLDELTAMAERELLLGEPEEIVRVQRRWWSSAGPLLSAAAVLVITVGGGWYVLQNTGGPADQPFGDAPGNRLAMLEEEQDLLLGRAGAESADDQYVGGDDASILAEERLADEFRTRGLARSATVDERLDKLTKPDAPRAVLMPAQKDADLVESAKTRLALGVKPVGGLNLSDEQNKRLIDTSSLEKKLEAQLPVKNLVDHPFANESNVLVVRAIDAVDERLARQQIATFATANSLQGVVTVEAGQFVSAGQPLIIEGRQHRNFQEEQQSQYILRIPKDRLMDLVLAMSTNDRAGRELSMALRGVFARNTDETKNLVAQVQTSPSGRRGPTLAKSGAKIARRRAPMSNVVPAPKRRLAADASTASEKTEADTYEFGETWRFGGKEVEPQDARSNASPADQDLKAGLREAGDTKQEGASTDDAGAPSSPLTKGLKAISRWLQPKQQIRQAEPSTRASTEIPARPGEIVKNQRERFEQSEDGRIRLPIESNQPAASRPAVEDLITVVVQIIQDQPGGRADP